MTSVDRSTRPYSPDQLNAALTEVGGTARPDYLDDLLGQVARTSQRPAWTFLERWIPMTLLAPARAPARTAAPAWRLLLIVALTAAVATGLAVAGMLLLRPHDADPFKAAVVLPSYELAATWDTSTITGLSVPSGLDVGPDGRLYVVNAGASEILVLDRDGTVQHRWGSHGTGDGEFDFLMRPEDVGYSIGAVSVGPDGIVSVADVLNDRIQQFRLADPAGAGPGGAEFVGTFGGWGTEAGRLMQPYELSTDHAGDIFVADNIRGDVQRFLGDGTHVGTPIALGNVEGDPIYISGGMDVDDRGISVVDYEHSTVNTWTTDGALARSVGQDGDGAARLAQPFDIAIDAHGNLLVTESNRLVVYGPDGRFASEWVAPHDRAAEDWLQVAVGPDGTAYLTAARQGRIYRLRVAELLTASPAPDVVIPTPMASAGATASTPIPSGASTQVEITGETFPVPFTAALPEHWAVFEETRGRVSMRLTRSPGNTPVYVVVTIPLNAYTDPCNAQDGPMDPPVGPSVDDLVDVLTNLAGYRPTSVRDVVLDGLPGRRFSLENASLDITTCSDDPWLRTWSYDGSRTGAVDKIPEGDVANGHSEVTVLDVAGTRVVVWLWAPAGDVRLDEVLLAEQVVDSIDFL